jgi:hypothetical protein
MSLLFVANAFEGKSNAEGARMRIRPCSAFGSARVAN